MKNRLGFGCTQPALGASGFRQGATQGTSCATLSLALSFLSAVIERNTILKYSLTKIPMIQRLHLRVSLIPYVIVNGLPHWFVVLEADVRVPEDLGTNATGLGANWCPIPRTAKGQGILKENRLSYAYTFSHELTDLGVYCHCPNKVDMVIWPR